MHKNLGIGSWIARRSRTTPDRVALLFQDETWTYRALDERITRLARALEGRGVGAQDRVAFLGHNHPAALETLFACGLLGAIYVPLHPGFDEPSLANVLGDASPRALIVTADLSSLAHRAVSAAAIHVPHSFVVGHLADAGERYEDLVASGADEPMDRPIGLDQPCLLAFSSGTTGPNKGVVLTHGNLFFNAVNVLTSVDYASDDVILTSAPLYRMGGLGFSLAMLLKGGACVLGERSDPEESLALVERHRVSVLFDAVSALEAMRDSPSFETRDLSSLRICLTGGSLIPVPLVDAFRRRGLRLLPGYGLTEAAPLALIVDGDEVDAHPGASGRPPLFCAVRIVGADLEDVARGAVGELLVHGPNVMRGYWNAPEATERALVENGWLRTGDAARASADGMITIVGRLSDALVVGGERIHPAPLEAALKERGLAADCAIVQPAPEALPTVFLAREPGRRIDGRRIQAFLEGELAPARPFVLCILDALPKNPNGKILRERLKRWAPLSLRPSQPSEARSRRPPRRARATSH